MFGFVLHGQRFRRLTRFVIVSGSAPSSATVSATWIEVTRAASVALSGSAGLHYLQNAAHVSGATRTRFVGRVQATIGLGTGGHF